MSGTRGSPLQGRHLRDDPDLLYLLREFETLYRHGSAGGSTVIRAHRKKVRDALSQVFTANPALVWRGASLKPVVAHFGRALDMADRTDMRPMARALRAVRPQLTWEYGYEAMPAVLARNYAYCEVLGPRGPVPSERLILGFVLFAPRTTYPQHSHDGIEESYISVSGAWSENNAAVYAPGSLILNRAGEEHRITIGETTPCLLAYAWVGGPQKLANPDMTLRRKGGRSR